MHNANACARVCTDAPFLFYLPLFTMFPPHSWGLNLQLALVNYMLPPALHLLLRRSLLKIPLQRTKGRLKLSRCVSLACTCSDRTGGRLIWNKLIYWITSPSVDAASQRLDLASVRFRFRGHLALILRLFFFSLCGQRADVPRRQYDNLPLAV